MLDRANKHDRQNSLLKRQALMPAEISGHTQIEDGVLHIETDKLQQRTQIERDGRQPFRLMSELHLLYDVAQALIGYLNDDDRRQVDVIANVMRPNLQQMGTVAQSCGIQWVDEGPARHPMLTYLHTIRHEVAAGGV